MSEQNKERAKVGGYKQRHKTNSIYANQDEVPGGFIVRASSKRVFVKARCQDCEATNPAKGFAPVFNDAPDGPDEVLVLLCNECYEERQSWPVSRSIAAYIRRQEAA